MSFDYLSKQDFAGEVVERIALFIGSNPDLLPLNP
jgi:hypothetical protein